MCSCDERYITIKSTHQLLCGHTFSMTQQWMQQKDTLFNKGEHIAELSNVVLSEQLILHFTNFRSCNVSYF